MRKRSNFFSNFGRKVLGFFKQKEDLKANAYQQHTINTNNDQLNASTPIKAVPTTSHRSLNVSRNHNVVDACSYGSFVELDFSHAASAPETWDDNLEDGETILLATVPLNEETTPVAPVGLSLNDDEPTP